MRTLHHAERRRARVKRNTRMYVPAWPGFTVRDVLLRRGTSRPFPFDAPVHTYFHTARSAIYHLFRKLVESGRTTVVAPDYHMGNELRAMRAAGARVRLYRVGRDWQPDLEAVRRACANGADVLFTIHYAGWPQPMRALRTLCDDWGLVLVEDCALALFSETDGQPVGSFGDYAVFCLYKTLPVPDGGLLVQRGHVFPDLMTLPLKRIGRAFEWGRAAELWIDRYRSRAPRTGAWLASAKRAVGAALTALHVERVPVGDVGFEATRASLGMSAWSRWVLRSIDGEEVRRRRRRNFSLLAALLRHSCRAVRWDLPPGMCPLFFPLLVAEKSAAARSLWERGVMATELWNEGDPASAHGEGADAQFLRRHVLELPIHQDLDERHIHYMARQVSELGLAGPAHPEAARRHTGDTTEQAESTVSRQG